MEIKRNNKEYSIKKNVRRRKGINDRGRYRKNKQRVTELHLVSQITTLTVMCSIYFEYKDRVKVKGRRNILYNVILY